VSGSPAGDAAEFRWELVEVLKQLNRAEMESLGVLGLELGELARTLARGPAPQVTQEDVHQAIRVLVGNGYAEELRDPEYAWDRSRVVADRYTITTGGKDFLVRALQKEGRI